VAASQKAMSKKAAVLRARPRSKPLSEEEIQIRAAPMRTLVEEEDAKERKRG
jgi:hypothetical protein